MSINNTHFAKALFAIYDERQRQEVLHPNSTPASPYMTDDRRLVILAEEVGEVARAIQDGKPEDVLAEVTQVAALAVAWMEAGLVT